MIGRLFFEGNETTHDNRTLRIGIVMTGTTTARWRIGVVSYVNTLPLVDGLDRLRELEMLAAPPSALIEQLLDGRVDLALCSIIDYQRSPKPLQIVPAGLLGCDGSTMTVRLFSHSPIERISRVCCDVESHTSVTLLRILLHELHGVKPELVDFDARDRRVRETDERVEWPEAMLLIGDKVVTDSTPAIRYPYQLDLGAEWKELTGLPFVFASWLAPADAEVSALGAVLDRQRRHNRQRLEVLLQRAAERGWPIDLAREYLTGMLRYEWTPEARVGVERFFEYAYRLGLIDENRPLRFASW
ncbi:MAG: menaquinone biosynthetic enzyme MqnA/MqnD family protein [Phycisphaerales bacterium]